MNNYLKQFITNQRPTVKEDAAVFDLSEAKKAQILAQSKYHVLETSYQVANFWQTRDLRDSAVVMEKVELVNEAVEAVETKKPLYDLTDMKQQLNKRFNK